MGAASSSTEMSILWFFFVHAAWSVCIMFSFFSCYFRVVCESGNVSPHSWMTAFFSQDSIWALLDWQRSCGTSRLKFLELMFLLYLFHFILFFIIHTLWWFTFRWSGLNNKKFLFTATLMGGGYPRGDSEWRTLSWRRGNKFVYFMQVFFVCIQMKHEDNTISPHCCSLKVINSLGPTSAALTSQ